MVLFVVCCGEYWNNYSSTKEGYCLPNIEMYWRKVSDSMEDRLPEFSKLLSQHYKVKEKIWNPSADINAGGNFQVILISPEKENLRFIFRGKDIGKAEFILATYGL